MFTGAAINVTLSDYSTKFHSRLLTTYILYYKFRKLFVFSRGYITLVNFLCRKYYNFTRSKFSSNRRVVIGKLSWLLNLTKNTNIIIIRHVNRNKDAENTSVLTL